MAQDAPKRRFLSLIFLVKIFIVKSFLVLTLRVEFGPPFSRLVMFNFFGKRAKQILNEDEHSWYNLHYKAPLPICSVETQQSSRKILLLSMIVAF